MPTLNDVLQESQDDFLLEKLLAGAKAHGSFSEPDHEVGDLQEVLRTCWEYLSPTQKLEVYEKHKELVTEWLGLES